MGLYEFTIDPDNVDANGVCESQSTSGAGNLTVDGALVSGGVATFDYPRRLVFASDGNETGTTITLTGTDHDGLALTENLAGPNATTVESTEYFKTVTQVATDAELNGDVTLGTVDELIKGWPLDYKSDDAASVHVKVTGTIDFTVQETFEAIQNHDPSVGFMERVAWTDISALADKTANTQGVANVNATGLRVQVNSYSSGAELKVSVRQPQLG